MTLKEKIISLKLQLETVGDNYAEIFKNDIHTLIGDFNSSNPILIFLKNLDSKEEITHWINKLTSRIVKKFDEDTETINDFIYDYIELG
ncbi:hypothetical protein WNY78_16065 [Psychroserpens sp. AS72]|uniref:hypothetical protein n=1 Tax=Psychroserpens sp. AS72 TaxID=3135775 RepID=UPI00316F18E1